MSLRLRLTLFYVLFLGLVLGLWGLGLHFGVKASLYQALDASLQDALLLVRPLVNQEDHRAFLGEGEALKDLPPDLALFLFQGARLVDRAGPILSPPQPAMGCWTARKVRFCGSQAEGLQLVAGRPLEWVDAALDRLDRVLQFSLPAAVFLAFLVGYALAGRALAPLDRVTRRALELAQRPDPKGRLPEHGAKDEVFRLARAQNLLLGALEGYLEKEKRFLQNAAHELRTPLAALVGRLEQALEQDPIPTAPVERAKEAAFDLWRLVERLLLLSRAERALTQEEVDFLGVVLEALEEAERGGKVLELQLPQAPCRLSGDPLLLKALVRNLLENAFKFARNRVRVSLSCEGVLELAVEDDGAGVPWGERERIFEAFHQASPAHRAQGSGLGLALVRRVAEAHGGMAGVEESVLGGARFFVRFPWRPIR